MLYLITYNFYLRPEDDDNNPFFEALDSLGTCRELWDGAFLLDSGKTALELRRELLGYFSGRDTLFIAKVFEGHSAGKLQSPSLKRFVAARWAFEPFPPPEFKGYYSF